MMQNDNDKFKFWLIVQVYCSSLGLCSKSVLELIVVPVFARLCCYFPTKFATRIGISKISKIPIHQTFKGLALYLHLARLLLESVKLQFKHMMKNVKKINIFLFIVLMIVIMTNGNLLILLMLHLHMMIINDWNH